LNFSNFQDRLEAAEMEAKQLRANLGDTERKAEVGFLSFFFTIFLASVPSFFNLVLSGSSFFFM